jgi:hypothetical protein
MFIMDLFQYVGKKIKVEFVNGHVISGFVSGYSGGQDNDETGEDELDIETSTGEIYGVWPSVVASIQVLEPAQSKKRFPLVAASL